MIANLKQLFLFLPVLMLVSCGPDGSESIKNEVAVPVKEESDNRIETVHFFLENSGSMFGYFRPTTIQGPEAFKDLGNILSELKLSVDTIKPYLISERVHPINVEVDEFKEYFQPAKMKIDGQGLESDITQMFSECIKRTSDHSVSILVSDGIYSIKSDNIIYELNRSSQDTKHRLKGLLRERDFAVAVAKFQGIFNGIYYPPKSGEEKINQIRPYYIWFFGDLPQIKKTIEIADIEGEDGYQNSAFFFKVNDIVCQSKILDSGSSKIGRYKSRTEDQVNIIEDPEKSNRGENTDQFQFGLAVNFQDLPLSPEFLENTANYSVNPKDYQVVNVIPRDELDETTNNAIKILVKDWEPTHILEVKKTSKLLGEFTITLNQKVSSWIHESSNNNDGSIVGDSTKTFGFKYLMVDGIFDAFDEVNDHKPYSSFYFKVEP